VSRAGQERRPERVPAAARVPHPAERGASRTDPALRFVSAVGNQAVQRLAARAACDPAGSRRLLRMVVAVGDLDELTRKGTKLTKDDRRSAASITEAAQRWVTATGELQAHPWDERFRPFKSGPLAAIGDEDLRIYGHGESRKGDEFVSQIGGYTASALAAKLIEMGLPEAYAGEIYLTGCNTAKGDDDGYLGVFYKLIAAHCPRVRVRGNLAVSVTFASGTQGVWSDTHPSHEDFKDVMKTLSDESDALIAAATQGIALARAERDPVRRAALVAAAKKLSADTELQLKAIRGQKDRLEHAAYSSESEFTRVLP
jgi:hypothetical protein